ncbi:MAG: discoidin domain-containing protein [Bacteroidaceae bacterium]|nr:discoidin domain-containing protein [Bacteroidaceae bacterium]MBR1800551.1 discoidin domain-containing protein [Bacteroidaceae bacterium]
MKKIYLLFVSLLALLGGFTPAFAQDDPVTIEVKKGVGDWLYANPARTWASQWQSDTTPKILIRESSSNNNGLGANNMAYWNGTNIQFFNCIGGNGTSDIYKVSVEDGWEFVELSVDFVASAADQGVYVEVMGEKSDLNNSTTDPVHFEYLFPSEVSEFDFTVGANTASKFANTSEFFITVQKKDPLFVAIDALYATQQQYVQYLEGGDYAFVTGTEPGNYDAELVAQFNELYNSITDEYVSTLTTIEEIDALREQLVAAYEAVIASKVTDMSLADGYYRFRTAIDYNDGETKYLYVVNNNGSMTGNWGTRADLENDCQSLFQIKNVGEGVYDIVSMSTDARFNDNPGSLSYESENQYVLEPLMTVDGVTYVDIRRNGVETGGYGYIHQASHGSGAGTGSNLTIWYPSYPAATSNKMGGSEWVIEAVDEVVAQAIIDAYAPIKNQEKLIANFNKLLDEANQAVKDAKDIQEYTELITDGSQFSSPWTSAAEGVGKDYGWEGLLDGVNTTYWHSDYSGGNIANHTHWLEVALNEPVNELIQLKITRRPVTNDHITLWGVFGSNEQDVAEVLYTEEDEEVINGEKAVGDVKVEGHEAEWTEVASLSTPFGNNTETITSKDFDTRGYKYLRFYIDGTTTGRGYGHVSEFQLVLPVPNENSQFAYMGEVATTLDALLKELNKLSNDEITEERYNALVEAYDAFKAQFVDPTELRELLAEIEPLINGVVVGSAPGYWSETSTVDALTATYNEAKAYDEGSVYAAAKSNQYVETLKEQAEAVRAAANKIQEGKWYRIHFGSKETFEANGWDIETNDPAVSNEVVVDEALWDKYITVANYATDQETVIVEGEDSEGNPTSEEVEVTYKTVVPIEDGEIITRNHYLFLDADEDIENKDLSMFRFVSVGDSAYVLQNKATGLFVGAYNSVRLDVLPSLFRVQAIGYGQNLLALTNLITDASQNYLHAQRSYNMVVTYGATTAGSRSALYLEEAGDVAEDYDGTEFFMNLKPGSVNSFCFPVGIQPAEDAEFYDVVAVEEGVIKLNTITEAIPGRPFIYIAAGDYDAELDDAEPYAFHHDYSLTKEAIAGPLLKGTYSTINLPKGALTTHADGFVVGESDVMSLYNVPANTAYVQAEAPFSLTLDYTYEIVTIEDGISATLQKVATTGELYTIDGRQLSRKANLNALKRYGKGIYILNGVKVVVK